MRSAAARAIGAAKAPPPPPWTLPAKRTVRVVENTWIPMPDGVRLAARLWIPDGAEKTPVPVVLEYIPYRMRAAYRTRDNRLQLF
jgi:predicted acyl esterase